MAIASIVLGVLSLLFATGGFLISFAPGVGAIPGAFLTLTSPLLALVGIVLGGVALSRAKNEGTETGLAVGGLVVSVVAFFPAFFVAVTCGLCDMFCASAMIQGNANRPRGGQVTPFYMVDAGLSGSPGLGPLPSAPPYPDPSLLPPDPSALPPAVPPPTDPGLIPPSDPTAVSPGPAADPSLPPPTPSGPFPPPPGQTP